MLSNDSFGLMIDIHAKTAAIKNFTATFLFNLFKLYLYYWSDFLSNFNIYWMLIYDF